MKRWQTIFAAMLFSLLLLSIAQAQNPNEGEFTPSSKAHLRGRRLDPQVFEDANNAKPSTEQQQTAVDIRSLVITELQRVRNDIGPKMAKAGLAASFKDVVSNVSVEGRFEILELNAPVSDNYIANLQRTIRGNLYPPIIARTLPQTSTVAVTFVVKNDGAITQIQKEDSTGSAALDSTAISACRSSSPLPPLSTTTVQDVIRMRFVLTYNP